MVPDTLVHLWTSSAELQFPRSVAIRDSNVFVGDVETASIIRFNLDGAATATISEPDWSYPYLAGVDARNLYVYLPSQARIDALNRLTSETTHIRTYDAGELGLSYASADSTLAARKLLPKESPGRLDLFRNRVDSASTIALDAPQWTFAGALLVDSDTVYSLRGYHPSIDVFTSRGLVQQRQLSGFDSPMLARAYNFRKGESDKPPLLSSDAALANDRFFVLNIRPGWLRVDVYSRGGSLQAILVEPNPSFGKHYYPTGVDVLFDRGRYLIAVSYKEPEPSVRLFAWTQR